MRKDKLLKLINNKKIKNSKVLCIYLLKKFLESEPIEKLNQNDVVSFKDYLDFLKKDFPNVAELFKEPYLKEDDKEETDLLNKFISSEKRKTPILFHNILEFDFDTISASAISNPASALITLPNGNIVSGYCSFDQYCNAEGRIDIRDPSGKIINSVNQPASALTTLPNGNIVSGYCSFDKYGNAAGQIDIRDPSGNSINSVNQPASALTTLPNGNIVSGYCSFDQYGNAEGRIDIRDPSGNIINSINHPASALTTLPNGNIVSGYCSFDQYGNAEGRIDIRDPSGNIINSIKQPASALTILPSGNIVSGYCTFDQYGYAEGRIDIRDPSGNIICSINQPASALTTLPNGNIASAYCSFDQYGYAEGRIAFNAIKLVQRKVQLREYRRIDLLGGINELLNDQSQLACILFHKGVVKPTGDISILCRLPRDILNIVYSYIFAGIQNYEILNKDCFPFPTQKDFKEIPIIRLLDKKVHDLMFFKQAKIMNDVKEILLNDIIEKRVFKSNVINDRNQKNDAQTEQKNHKGKKCSIM